MKDVSEGDERLAAVIPGDVNELRGLRSAVSSWLEANAIHTGLRDGLVLAAHEGSAQAIELGAPDVRVEAEVRDDVIRLAVKDGGTLKALDPTRDKLVRGLLPRVRVERQALGLTFVVPNAAE